MSNNEVVNEIKNMNESYNEFTDEQERNQKKSRGLWLDLLLGLQLANLVLSVTLGISPRMSLFIYIILLLFVVTTSIITPIRKYRKAKAFIHPMYKVWSLLRIGFAAIFLLTLYIILFSHNYGLHYTYYVCIITMYMIVLISYIEKIRLDYLGKMRKEEEHSLLQKLMVVIFFVVLLISTVVLMRFFVSPVKQLSYQMVSTPDYITAYEIKYDKFGEKIFDYANMITISDPSILEQITKDITESSSQSMTATQLLNYARQKEHNTPYYHISFCFYDNNENWFETGELTYLVITSKHTAAIEKSKLSTRFLLRTSDTRTVYPIELSDATYQALYSYLK